MEGQRGFPSVLPGQMPGNNLIHSTKRREVSSVPSLHRGDCDSLGGRHYPGLPDICRRDPLGACPDSSVTGLYHVCCPAQAALASLVRLWAVQMIAHSAFTLSMPRSRNCLEQAGQGLKVPLAELRDGAEVRRITRHDHHEVRPLSLRDYDLGHCWTRRCASSVRALRAIAGGAHMSSLTQRPSQSASSQPRSDPARTVFRSPHPLRGPYPPI